jgi:hypothetical protein
VIVAPPLEGATHETETDWFPGVPLGAVGVEGAPTGIVNGDVPAALVPSEFVAVTLKVYAVPLVRPDTVHWGVAAVGATDDVEHSFPDWSDCPT